ncbi:hypothetical protein AB0D49_36375 [Streptomyces sp. NPDC048290]|uniref:hypothetical protein n=1 Tax=Streptomyces sp. NPDC048290 TaxID=3155811 RepID=UPI003424C85B
MYDDDRIDEGVPAPLAALLRDPDDPRPVRIVPCVCAGCGGRTFTALVGESAAARECAGCARRAFIADSEEYWGPEFWEEEGEPGRAGCPCGGEEFEAAVAFSVDGDGAVRWVTLGLRCVADGDCGVYADWKIDYLPTDHLFALV